MSLPRKAYPRRVLRLLAPLTAAAMLLSGCGSSDNSVFSLVVIGEPDDPFETGARLSLAGQLARSATAEGLVSFDEQGRVVPALADRWIVTDDGQSYIFRLREGNWRNGDSLTARSAQTALNAAIRSLRGTPMAQDLSGIDEVRAMAGRVIEVRLFRPMPFLLQILAQPELGLVHDKQGDGPMTMTRSGNQARFTPIDPSRLGLPKIAQWSSRTRQLELSAVSAADAVRQFNAGDVDLVLGGKIQSFPLTSSVGILRGTIQLDPVIGLFGLRVAKRDGFLAEAGNREALAMAIDRAALIGPFGVGGWNASTRLVSGSVQGDLTPSQERWQALTIDQRRATAAARVRTWLAATRPDGGTSPPTVSIWLPEGPGAQIIFNRLESDFRAIGVEAVRAKQVSSADLRLVDEAARFPRVSWFLNRLTCDSPSDLCDPDADALITSAIKVTDPAQRAGLLAQAERKLTDDNIFIPFGAPIRWSLVRGDVDGFAANAWGWHPLMPLAWLHK